MLNLTQFSHLVALADEGHFARAAAKVHLSQPAFSRSIQAAERTLGLRLFERDHNPIRPTPAGVFLIEKARQLVFDARCLERDIQLYQQGALGDTAFGMGPFPAATLLREVVGCVRETHPNIGIRVEINNWRLLLERLRKEDIEFFVAATADIALLDDLQIESLMKQSVNFYARLRHPLRNRLKLVDVWSHGVAATKITPTLEATISRVLKLPAEQSLDLALQCDDVDVLHHTALTSDTVIISTDLAVRKKGHDKLLRKLDVIDFPTAHVSMGIISLRKRTHSPMAHEIIRVIEQIAQDST
ncbi:MAG: LysR family transcriptional regulator [Betaproteobacteria bacterium]